MVKHKKTKQVNNKKKKKANKVKDDANAPKKIPSVEEMIQAGDTAAASMEGDKALAFYASAEQILREKKEEKSSTTSTEQLVSVLEKLGEARASLGDEEQARQDFQNAIDLVTASPQDKKTNPQFQETLAGLHLYIGQLSAEQEALAALKKGLQCLEASVELRQQECANTPAQISEDDEEAMMDDDEEDGKEKANHTAVALNEAR